MMTLVDIFERPKREIKNKIVKKQKMITTPKEKAKELINNFSRTHVLGVENTKGKLVSPYSSGYASIEVRNIRAKNSALIAVYEIINCDTFFKTLQDSKDFTDYWYKVQQEIQKA